MMTLFHGSYIEIKTPLANAGRRNLDFGQGFYLTKVEKQAHDWAEAIAGKRGRKVSPVMSVYNFHIIWNGFSSLLIAEMVEMFIVSMML